MGSKGREGGDRRKEDDRGKKSRVRLNASTTLLRRDSPSVVDLFAVLRRRLVTALAVLALLAGRGIRGVEDRLLVLAKGEVDEGVVEVELLDTGGDGKVLVELR